MKQYHEEGVVYQSVVKGQQYFVSQADETAAQVERIDAIAEQPVTYASYETAVSRTREAGGSVPFSDAHGTVAVRTSWLQGNHFWISEDRNRLILIEKPSDIEAAL